MAAVFAAAPAFAGDFALNGVTAADVPDQPAAVKDIHVQPSITSDAFDNVPHVVAPSGNSALASNGQVSGNAGHQKADQALLDKARDLRDTMEQQMRYGDEIADDLDGMRSAVRRLDDKRDDDLENRICDRNLRMIGNVDAVTGINDTLNSLLASAVSDNELFRIASEINSDAAALYRTYNGYVHPGADGLASDVDGLKDNLMGDSARGCADSLSYKARNIERTAEDILNQSDKFYNASR